MHSLAEQGLALSFQVVRYVWEIKPGVREGAVVFSTSTRNF